MCNILLYFEIHQIIRTVRPWEHECLQPLRCNRRYAFILLSDWCIMIHIRLCMTLEMQTKQVSSKKELVNVAFAKWGQICTFIHYLCRKCTVFVDFQHLKVFQTNCSHFDSILIFSLDRFEWIFSCRSTPALWCSLLEVSFVFVCPKRNWRQVMFLPFLSLMDDVDCLFSFFFLHSGN